MRNLCDFSGDDRKCPRCGFVSLYGHAQRDCTAVSSDKPQQQGEPTAPSTHGPGTELKKLLAKVGITAAPDCSCNARAAEMDRQGVEWCEANLDTIVGWLREQAEARGLPFLDAAGRMLVLRAISNARRNA
jgi:hypothetical protein